MQVHDARFVFLQARHPEARGFHEDLEPVVSHEFDVAGRLGVLVDRIRNVRVLVPHVITYTPRRLFGSVIGVGHPRETSTR